MRSKKNLFLICIERGNEIRYLKLSNKISINRKFLLILIERGFKS